MVIGLTHQLPLEREMSAVCLPPPKAFKDDEDQIDTDRPTLVADYDFEYADDVGLQEQLSDFYNYQDLPAVSLPLLRERFGEFQNSRESLLRARLSDLGLSSSGHRFETLAMLLSWSLGNVQESEESLLFPERHLAAIAQSNETLNAIGGLLPIYASFVNTFEDLEEWMATSQEYSQLHHRGHHHPPMSQTELRDLIERLERTPVVQSALMAQSLLFNVIVCNASKEDFCDQVARMEPPLDCFLFGLLSRAVDPFWKKLFLKKSLLLLWKSLLVIHGGLDTLEKRKNETRSALGLSTKPTDFYQPKVGPEDYDFYFHDMKKRYPNYLLPVPTPDLPTPPTFIRRQIAEYPLRLHPFVSKDGHLLPLAVRESLQIFNENMYKSHGSVQMARSQRNRQATNTSFAMDRIQVLYKYLLPNMNAHMTTLLRHLYALGLSSNSGHVSPTMDLTSDLPFSKMSTDQKTKLLEIGDQTRTIKIYRKAMSAILLLLLKAVKTHHVMEFEHICFVLAETNFPLIFLKLLVSWFPSNVVRNSTGDRTIKVERPVLPAGDAWLRQKEEPLELNFFHFCHQRDMLQDPWRRLKDPASPSSNRSSVSTKTEEDLRPASFSSFFTTINLLRVLQKITKNKYCRLLHLIQLKTCNILQRVLKIRHRDLELYALKLIKSQIPFLGKKWKVNHMSIVSSIYMTLKPRLVEEYLSADLEIQPAEAAKTEKELQNTIKEYNSRVYPPVDYSASSSLKRSQRSTDDLDLALTLAQQGIYDPLNPAHAQLLSSSALPEHITTRPPPEQEDEQMNDYFKAHYKDWLESEFFGSTDDGVQESMAELLRELQEEDGVEYGGIEWSHERESGRVSSSEHRDAGKRVILFENRESVRGWIAEDVPMTQVSYGWDESFPSED